MHTIVRSLSSEAGEGVVVSAGSSVRFRCHTDDRFSESDVSVQYLSALAASVLLVCNRNCCSDLWLENSGSNFRFLFYLFKTEK